MRSFALMRIKLRRRTVRTAHDDLRIVLSG
jgi:hypothetical protein